MIKRHELTDEQWARLKDLLPPQKPRTGRPSIDHRTMVNGMLWIARTGAPWRDLPERYGKWTSVYSRFQRGRKAGIWERVLSEVQRQGDQQGKLDWEIHFVDGSIVRAHQHAAGAKKAPQKPKP
jgi:transposase